MRNNNYAIKNPVHLIILFIILVGSDMVIAFYSHYVGATDAEFSIDAFMEYLSTLDAMEYLFIFGFAIFICLVVFLLGGG